MPWGSGLPWTSGEPAAAVYPRSRRTSFAAASDHGADEPCSIQDPIGTPENIRRDRQADSPRIRRAGARLEKCWFQQISVPEFCQQSIAQLS